MIHQEALTEDGSKLFPLLKHFGDFYLAGGTALALQIGYRLSVDFDLFSAQKISPNLLLNVEKIFHGRIIKPTINNSDELTVFIDDIKTTFLYYPFPVVEPLPEHEDIKFLSIKEIGATKAYTIGRRGVYKDYVDIYSILSENHAGLEEIIDMAERKFGEKFNSRLFLEQLIFLDDIKDIKISFLKSPVSREEILDFFKKSIQKLNL